MKSQLSVSSHSDMVIDEWMAILCRIVESKWIKGGSIWSRGGRSLKNWLVASGVPLLFDWPGIFYVPDVPEEGGDGVRHYWIQYSSLCRLRQQAVVLGSFDTGVPKLDMSTFVNAPWFEDIAPPSPTDHDYPFAQTPLSRFELANYSWFAAAT